MDNLTDATDEQLDEALSQMEKIDSEDVDIEFGAEEEEAAAKPEDGEVEEAEAEEEEEEAAEEVVAEAEAGPDEYDAQAQIEAMESRLGMMETELEAKNAALEREKLISDRNAGKLGSLLQKLEKGRDVTHASGDEFDDEEADVKRQPKSSPEVSEELLEVRAERVERSIRDSASSFLQGNLEFFSELEKGAGKEVSDKFQADLVTRVREQQVALGDDLYTMAPKTAAKLAQTFIKSAFAEAKLSLMRELRDSAAKDSEKSRRNIRGQKSGAAGVRSNKRAAASSSGKQKSLDKMSDKELDAILAASTFD